MEERLKLFLAMEGLSPSQFADKLGVQRSGVSHLLSGRNKPSFEFINKMLVTFPKINPDWLITGNGKAYRDFPTQQAESNASAQLQPEPYSGETVDASLEENSVTDNEPSLFPTDSPSESASQRASSTPASPYQSVQMQQIPQTAAQPEEPSKSSEPQRVIAHQPQKYPSENRVKIPVIAGNPAKRIAQITILYTDGTYEIR